MRTIAFSFLWCAFCISGIAQNIIVSFSASGAASQIDSITATNLRTRQSIAFPGNETLNLTVSTGTSPESELTGAVIVFPNPFSGKATVRVAILKYQALDIKVQNLMGQVIAQSKTVAGPGENEFELSVATAGIYLVSLTTGQGIVGFKVICTKPIGLENSIQYLGSCTANPGNHNNHNNLNDSSSSELKSSSTGYFLVYKPGDVILYRCRSGIYTTIKTDTPGSSKNYDVGFAACQDPDGRNYSIVKIGTQTWMAENLAYLPSVSPASSVSNFSPYYYVYDYDGPSTIEAKTMPNYTIYGVLYNWLTVKSICPTGWHLPSDEEWTILTNYLGFYSAYQMKETGTAH